MSLVAVRRRRAATRRWALAVCLASALLTLLSGPTALAAWRVGQAPTIRASSLAAKSSLANAWRFAAKRKSACRDALRDGIARVDEAHRVASAAAWPTALFDERDRLLSDLSKTLANVSVLDSGKHLPRTGR